MEHFYRTIISGERASAGAAILRALFSAISLPYTLAIILRNWLFDVGLRKQHKLSVPVISVGNITTGGTGKTPTVIMLVHELQRLGHKPAVITRGYGAPRLADGARGKSDEVMVLEHECPGVPVVVDADRVKAGKIAIEKFAADVLVMDDGFQHRRLQRDLNILLIDATEPMGVPGVIPRGTWREPPSALRRANMIMLTRCEQVFPQLAELAGNLLTNWVKPRSIFQQRTEVTGIFDASGNRVPLQVGGTRKVLAFSGIGNPNGFLHTVRSLGLTVSAASWFPDHHLYRPERDFNSMKKITAQRGIDAWVTTLKDFVKLPASPSPVPLWYIRIECRLSPQSQDLLRLRLQELFLPTSPATAPRS